ncbi:MAG: SIS domain-containing protein [Melioribacteraceae bacterium]|nr:SIS domain-containing protein [Melioribacteraceae bacterium]
MENRYLGYSKDELIKLSGYNTAKEIKSQDKLWRETYSLVLNHKLEIFNFLQKVFSQSNSNVILTGAGTSAFIGDVLESVFQTHTGVNCRAIPTTTLVTHPSQYFQKEKSTLLISFARSGNSPESIKAVELANEVCENIFHLVITCDANGELAKIISDGNGYLLVLPEETNDKSLAMTSSFTSMLLSGILISRINELEKLQTQVELLSSYAENIFRNYLPQLNKIAEMDFNRAVFLGSGLFEGIARESHLKLQELTNGKVICKHDSFLGFRHGPKAVIDDKTLVVYLFSNDPYVQKYEEDLVLSVEAEKNALYTLAIMESNIKDVNSDSRIILSESDQILDEEFLTIVSTLPAQILGFYKSLKYGLKPDSPSENGAINRVVQGVNLYSYDEKKH